MGLVSYDFDHALKVIDPFIALLTDLFGADSFESNKNEHWLRFKKTRAELHWLSSESVRSGQGNTFSRVYLDESQNIPDEFWTNLRPALGVRMARVFAFGTPDPVVDSSWFKGLFLRGQDEEQTDYYSYSIPCTLNKWLPFDDIEDAAATLTESEFRKKYLGEWVDDDGTVFPNADAAFTGDYSNPVAGHSYVIGLDLAKHEDFTVAYVVDRSVRPKQVVHRYRINHLNYEDVANQVAAIHRKYHAVVKVDVTGVGDAVADMLRARQVSLSPYLFSNKEKERLVSHLQRAFQRNEIVVPKQDRQLLRELGAFRRVVSKAGNVQYSAPVGFNDDCVMALGLANLASETGGSIKVSQYAYGKPQSAFVD